MAAVNPTIDEILTMFSYSSAMKPGYETEIERAIRRAFVKATGKIIFTELFQKVLVGKLSIIWSRNHTN